MTLPTRLRPTHLWQRLRLGFWPDEVWSLDQTVARFILPRLRYLREIEHGYPDDGEPDAEVRWHATLDEIEWALDFIADDERFYGPSTVEAQERMAEGLRLLGKHFTSLWD